MLRKLQRNRVGELMSWQPIPINFGGSIDTKTDPKTVVAGRFLQARDVVYTAIDQAQKRNGYRALASALQNTGSLIAPQMAHDFQGDLIAADGGLLLSYSKSLQSWRPRGSYVSTDITRQTIDGENPSSGFADVAVLGNYALYAWSTITGAGNSFNPVPKVGTMYAAVVDLQTGTTVLGPQVLSTWTDAEVPLTVRCVTLGGSTLAVLYSYPHGGLGVVDLAIRTVSFPSAGNISLSAQTTIGAGNLDVSSVFDVAPTSAGGAVAYPSGGDLKIYTISTAGAVVNSATVAGGGVAYIALDTGTGNLWVYFPKGGNMDVAVYTSVLGVVLAPQDMFAATAVGSVTSFIALPVNATTQKLYIAGTAKSGQNGGVDTTIETTYAVTVPIAGWPQTLTPTVFQYGVMPVSRPFSVTGNVGTRGGAQTDYAMFLYRGKISSAFNQLLQQPTLFAVELNPSAAPGVNQYTPLRFGSGVVNSLAAQVWRTLGSMMQCQVPALSATKFLYAYAQNVQEFHSPTFLDGEGFCNTFSLTIDFNSARAYKPVNAGKLALLNGGVLQAYDGQVCSEFGFHLFPEITGVNYSNVVGGGLVAGQTYYYIAIFQWIDAQGNQHQSEPSEPFQITVTPGNNTATLFVTIPYLSQKNLVGVSLFRSPASSSGQGTAWFQVSDPSYPLLPTGSDAYVSFADGLSDTQIQSALVPYTSDVSPVLTNTAPPPCIIMTARNNRLWMVNAESTTEEWYTKKFTPGVGLSPSAFLLNQIDPKLGGVVGVAEMDEKLVSFAEQGFYVQTGDGADDTGANSTLTEAQPIPSDVSCDNHKSIFITPAGVMFHSANGIYLLSRALGVTYIGMDVEAYNSQVITAATRIPGKSQIRFLCSSGLTLVYDYIFNKWATFSNHTGLGAAIWQNTYVYVTGATVLQETAGWYLDVNTQIAPLIQTGWLNVAGIQGFERARLLELLGDFVNGASAAHGVQISAAYDFNTTFGTPVPYVFGAAAASGSYQYRERLLQQKFDTISLLIQEIPTGDSAEYIDFTNMSFEAMIKKGLRKVPNTQMVG